MVGAVSFMLIDRRLLVRAFDVLNLGTAMVEPLHFVVIGLITTGRPYTDFEKMSRCVSAVKYHILFSAFRKGDCLWIPCTCAGFPLLPAVLFPEEAFHAE